jgi:hypothetical protein
MKKALSLIALLWLATESSDQIFAESDCGTLFLGQLLSADGVQLETTGLRLSAVRSVPYPENSAVRGLRYADELYVEVSRGDDLDVIATILGQGRNESQLRQRLQIELEQAGGQQVFLPLSEFLPETAKKLVGTFAKCNDPNCFNAATMFHDSKVGVRGVSEAEFLNIMNSQYQRLEKDDGIRLGDVVVIFAGKHKHQGSVLHAAVYLGNGFFYHKASSSMTTPYVYEHAEGVFHPYQDFVKAGLGLNVSVFRYNREANGQ